MAQSAVVASAVARVVVAPPCGRTRHEDLPESPQLNLDQSTRLRFLCIDEPVRQALRDFRPLLAQHLDGILDEIYVNIAQYPVAAKVYTGLASYEDLKRGQKRHFLEHLFTGAFGEEYFSSVVRAAHARERAGVEPRWYLGCYSTIMQKMNDIAVVAYHKKPKRLVQVLEAINRAVLLDIDLAVSVYFKATQDSASKRLNEHADIFERDISGMVGVVASAATQLQSTAQALAGGATLASRESTAVAAAAQQASSNVQMVAAATEELSASISEISRRVNESSRIAGSAVDEAERSNGLVLGLATAADKIGHVVKLINVIANQTNMLALNATIEAMRAGEVGRGFAVVAGEVKSLASQTARATGEISAEVLAVQRATQEAVEAIRGIGATIARINEVAAAIAAAVEQQGAAAHEIARNIQHASQSTTTVTTTIATVAASVGQTGLSSHQLLTASERLSRQSEQLSAEVSRFLSVIRKDV